METSQKRFAVITGASSGIGYWLAMEFAKNGFDIMIAAENDGIHEVANAFREHGNKVLPVQVDLRKSEEVEKLYQEIKAIDCPVDAIAINAGVGVGGEFEKTELKREIGMIQLNVTSTVHLAKLVLKDMLGRGEGKILFTSSIAAEMPGPYYAVYAATKAFVQSFSEALRQEVKDRGITITALQPGATETDFFRRADMEDTKAGESEKDSPELVAQQAFAALMDGKDSVVAGSFKNKMQVGMAKILPETVGAKMQGSSAKPKSLDKH